VEDETRAADQFDWRPSHEYSEACARSKASIGHEVLRLMHFIEAERAKVRAAWDAIQPHLRFGVRPPDDPGEPILPDAVTVGS
jgi:hypothetical protein